MSMSKYEWPNTNPIEIFDGTLSLVAETVSPDDTEHAKQMLYTAFAQAAFQGNIASVDLTAVHDASAINILKERVIPTLSDWLAEFPEDVPKLVDDSRDRGENND